MTDGNMISRPRSGAAIEPDVPARRPPAGPRRRTEEVLAAAASVFAELGFHGATTQDIADRVGMRQASLYYYFVSKEAALEQVCQRGIEHIIGDTEAIAAGTGGATDKLAAIMRRHIEPLSENSASLRAFLHERRFLPKDARRRIARLARRYERIVENVVAAGMEAGELRPDLNPTLTMDAVLGICNAAAYWPGKERVGSMREIADGLVRLVLDGIAAPKAH